MIMNKLFVEYDLVLPSAPVARALGYICVNPFHNYLFQDFFFPSEVSKERKFWLWAFACMYNYEYTRLTAGGGLIESFAAFDSLAWNLLKNLLDTKNW